MFSWVLNMPLDDINEERKTNESTCGRNLWLLISLQLKSFGRTSYERTRKADEL